MFELFNHNTSNKVQNYNCTSVNKSTWTAVIVNDVLYEIDYFKASTQNCCAKASYFHRRILMSARLLHRGGFFCIHKCSLETL